MERNFIIFCICLLFFGAEFAAILPGLNEYLKTFDGNQRFSYLGLALSAFSLAEFIFSPIFGIIYDRKLCSSRNIVLLSTLFGIAGNILYTFASSPELVVISRFMAGIGAGCQSTICASILRVTAEKEKSTKLGKIMMSRNIGVIIGPSYNLILLKVDFYIGPIHVTSVSAIGLFLAFLWIVYGLVLYFAYDLSNAEINSAAETNQVKEIGWKIVYKDIWRAEVITCMVTTFTFTFYQAMMETISTPLTEKLLNWTTFENGILYLIIGILLVAMFLIFMKLTAFISDRRMLFCGYLALFIQNIAFSIFLYTAQDVVVGTLWAVATLATIYVIYIFIIPFALIPQISILSKITMKESSGFNQGMRGSVRSIAAISGPLWTSFNFSNPLLLGFGATTFTAISLLMVICTYRNLNWKEVLDEDDEPQADETISLIKLNCE